MFAHVFNASRAFRFQLALLALLALTVVPPPRAEAQAPPSPRPDSAQARDTLETVVIRATRAGGATPTSATTLDRASIERTYLGQDAPLALLGATSLTAASDAGAFSGYSSLRLRGVDQTRLAISVDGIPLKDPEDQVLYFSNVPDFRYSMQSVRVSRGVGSSAFGTASFAGSLSFESLPLMTTPRFAEGQVTAGSWGTQRLSVEGASGLSGSVAAYGRFSTQSTDGYRDHSGNESESGFFSAGWFGARDALKVTGFAGRSRMQLAYYAPSEAELAADPRANPMSPDETDDFHQEMVSLQYTRVVRPGATLTTTGYRNSAGGWFDVNVSGDLWNFNLDHVWHGVLSTLEWSRPDRTVTAGAHLSRYARDHTLYIRPDLASEIYANTGHKSEQSAFVKATWTRGSVDWHADVQLRRAAFRYEPSSGTSFGSPRIDWVFVNPKVGVSWRARPTLEVFASLGQSTREPTRSDLFAGADDLDDAAAAEVLPLDGVRPERLTDLELGARHTRGTFVASVNAFAMLFRDEIAPIGALSITGGQLRRNVDRSTRVGIEVESAWRPHASLVLSGNATVMRARIAAFEDEAAATTYRDVAPLLTPALLANAQVAWNPIALAELTLVARHVGESQLANDGNRALVAPAYTLADLGASYRLQKTVFRVQIQNLFDATA
jgi:iron complex outermembrane receptor protein